MKTIPDKKIKLQKTNISVVICTYRNPILLKGVLTSLIEQDFDKDSYEILIIDNNSMDETPKVVREIACQHSNIHYFFEPKQGLSYARNYGVREANGDLIAFIDDDSIAHPHWLKELKACFIDEEVWAAGGKVVLRWLLEKPKWLGESLLDNLSRTKLGDTCRFLHWPEHVIGGNCAFRKIVFDEVGYFNERLGRKGKLQVGNEETELQQRIYNAGKKIAYNPDSLVYHLVQPERVTKKYFLTRAYGTGISQSIIDFEGNTLSWKKQILVSIKNILKTLYKYLMNLFSSEKRFASIKSFVYHWGYLLQSFKNLLYRSNL